MAKKNFETSLIGARVMITLGCTPEQLEKNREMRPATDRPWIYCEKQGEVVNVWVADGKIQLGVLMEESGEIVDFPTTHVRVLKDSE